MKTVMILGGSESEVPVIEASLKQGHKTIVVDRSNDCAAFHVGGVVVEHCSIADKDKILELAKKYNIDGILPEVDAGVRTSAYVAKVLGLPGISKEAAFMGTDKVAMRKRLKEKGVPVPEFYEIKTKKDYYDAISHFSDKCIVKAADSSGSRGIYELRDLTNKKESDYAYDYCVQFSGTGELLVEEMMEGQEICAETLSSDGVCYPIQITDQQHKIPPYFTDSGYSQPSMLPKETVDKIKQIAIDANMAVENYQGSSGTEMIVTKDGPKIVELGVRLSGDFMTTKMIPLSNGVDMPGDVVRICLGEPINVTPKINKASCVRYFMKERVGIIKAVTGIDDAKAVPGIVEVGILKGVGQEATPLRKSSDRLGYVIAQRDTPQEAIEAAELALSKIDFVVEETTR